MPKASFATWALFFVDKEEEKFVNIFDIDFSDYGLVEVGNQNQGQALFENFLESLRSKVIRGAGSDSTQFIQLDNVNKVDNYYLGGAFQKGVYGHQKDIGNAFTGIKNGHILPDEAALDYYNFLIHTDRSQQPALVTLQRQGQGVIKSLFWQELNKFLKDIRKDYKYHFQPAVSTKVIKEIIRNGEITKIKVVSSEIQKDRADLNVALLSDGTSFEKTFKNRAGFDVKDDIIKVIDNRRSNFLISGQSVSNDSIWNLQDDDKVTITVQGKLKPWTIDIHEFRSFRPYYVVPYLEEDKNEAGWIKPDIFQKLVMDFFQDFDLDVEKYLQ